MHTNPYVCVCIHIVSKTINLSILIIYLIITVFATGPGDRGSTPGRVIQKIQKMVLDSTFLYTQHYKVQINGKVEQSRESSSVVAIEKGIFGSPSIMVVNFIYKYLSSLTHTQIYFTYPHIIYQVISLSLSIYIYILKSRI